MGDRLAAWASLVADRLFGPVFTLDATRVGRRLSTFIIRWAFLLVLVSVLGMFYYSWRRDLNAPGGVVHPTVLTRFAENFFWVYSVTQFLIIATLTPGFTAATITDEKERKTLHFLLVTDLTGREIVFGKLAARVGALLTLVIAGLPIVSIMQFFGGIEPRLLLVSVSMTIATVVSLSAVSVAASVLMARTRDAVLLAYALPVGYLYFSFGAANMLRNSTAPEWQTVVEVFTAGNPFAAADQMGRTFGGDGFPPAAVRYVVFHSIVAVLGIAFAAFRVRASVRREGAGASKPRSRPARMLAWVLGRRSKARWHPPVSDKPIRWREIHVEPGSSSGILHRLFVMAVLFAICFPFLRIVGDLLFFDGYSPNYSYRRGEPFKDFQSEIKVWVCSVTCCLGLLMMLRATVRGASSVASERDRDTWVSLLGTPLPVREILWGKWAGCVWGQRDAMVLLGVVWAIGVVTLSINPLALIPTALALGTYLNAFAWLGISCSAAARSSRVAIGQAVPMALFLGGGYWFILGCCCAGVGIGGGGEVLAFPMAFTAALTPGVVLALTPAIDLEVLREVTRDSIGPFGIGIVISVVAGYVCGTVGCMLLGAAWADKAHAKFAREANREEEIPGTRPRRSRPAPRQEDRRESWDNEDST